jgi:MoaA/NifB/PqqE/SkfB family radical SAM enzyme
MRTRYDSVRQNNFDITLSFAYHVVMNIYRHFDAKKNLFDTISIQTQTGCNYSCPTCPANKRGLRLYGGAAQGTKMDIVLFKNIIEQLSEVGFRGRISPYLMNEPLMDARLGDFVSIIKKKCPQAFVFIQTNGSLLNKKLIMDLINAGVDELYVNDYREDHAIVNLLNTMPLDKKYRNHITVEKRFLNENLSNRAGNVSFSYTLEEPLAIPCVKPFRQLCITYDGHAILCCQDWQFTQIVGDVTKETLLDIWTNEMYESIRHNLKNRNRFNNALCVQCDFSGLW